MSVEEISSVDRQQRRQAERIESFLRHGISAQRGSCLGYVEFSAGEADKLLRLLSEVKRLRETSR